MIRATPNSVRFDQVNKVNYRFQALHFQSDVLEALVSNSPPLQRRDRAATTPAGGNKVVAKEGRVHSDGSTTKQDVLNSSFIQKPQSTPASKDTAEEFRKSSSGSQAIRRKSGMTKSIIKTPCTSSLSINTTEDESENDTRSQGGETNRSSVHERVPVLTMSDDVFNAEDDALDRKSKEELKSMVISLQKELQDAKRQDEAVPKNGIKLPLHTSRATSPLDRYRQSHTVNSVTRSLISHVKELETEVQRAQNVASRFQEELSILKSRLDVVITHCGNIQKELVVSETKESGVQILCFGVSENEEDDDPSIKKLKEISGI